MLSTCSRWHQILSRRTIHTAKPLCKVYKICKLISPTKEGNMLLNKFCSRFCSFTKRSSFKRSLFFPPPYWRGSFLPILSTRSVVTKLSIPLSGITLFLHLASNPDSIPFCPPGIYFNNRIRWFRRRNRHNRSTFRYSRQARDTHHAPVPDPYHI